MPNTERRPLEYSGIFYDSANLEQFEAWLKTGVLGGATTNPVIFAKESITNVVGHITEMVAIAGNNFPISIELPDADWPKEDMVALALKYQETFPDNAVIKVPMKPNEPEKALEIIYKLGQEGIRVNATIGITAGQLFTAAEATRQSKADGDNYISLFWGRREEAKQQIIEAKLAEFKIPNDLRPKAIKQLEKQIPDAAATLAMTLDYLINHSLNTKVIVGSIRSTGQIEQAFKTGADIVTIPPSLLAEWMYSQRGMETVDQFNQAYREVADQVNLI